MERVGRPAPRRAVVVLALIALGFLAIVEPGASQEVNDAAADNCKLTTVVFVDSELRSYAGQNVTSTTPVDLDCVADGGEAWFDIMLVSSDLKHQAGYQPEQTAEVWKVQGFDDAGTLQYESPLTADLPETATRQAMLIHTAELSKVTYFQAVHGGDTANSNSVDALVILEPTTDPNPRPPTTTTTIRPTTTTTLPATTTTTPATTTTTMPPTGPPRCTQPSPAFAEELEGNPYKNQVWRLYHTLLGRPPIDTGLNFWASVRDESLQSHFTIARFFYTSQEARSARLAEMSNDEFVLHLFSMIGCRTPSQEGLRYWTQLLDNGADRWAVAVWFSESPEIIRLTKTEFPLFEDLDALLQALYNSTD